MHVLAPFCVAMLFMFVLVLNKNVRDETGAVRIDLLKRITLGKVLRILAIVLLAFAFIYMLPVDLAIIYAGDVLGYFEVFTAVSLFVAQGRARTMWRLIRFLAGDARRAFAKLFVGSAQKCVSRYRYAIRAHRRKRVTAISKKSGEDAGPIRWGIPA